MELHEFQDTHLNKHFHLREVLVKTDKVIDEVNVMEQKTESKKLDTGHDTQGWLGVRGAN